MKLLIAVTSIMVNIMGQNIHSQCLPNGCFYDLEEDLTRDIVCRADGRQQISYFHGNNGCGLPKYLLRDLRYISPLNNPCCKSKPAPFEPLLCGGACVDGNNSTCNAGCSCIDDACQTGELELPTATSYSIKIENNSTRDQIVGIYQENPISGVGYPIVFASSPIEAGGGIGTLQWTIDWGLSWSWGSAGCTPLTGNVEYERAGKIIEVQAEANTQNGASITYDESMDIYDISGAQFTDININTSGQLEIETDNSFSSKQAVQDCFSVCITQSNEPIFAINGLPGNKYQFTLKPTYYLSTSLTKVSTTVDTDVVSNPTKVMFENGNNNIKCSLNDKYGDIVC